jgi:hypothetical protein
VFTGLFRPAARGLKVERRWKKKKKYKAQHKKFGDRGMSGK